MERRVTLHEYRDVIYLAKSVPKPNPTCLDVPMCLHCSSRQATNLGGVRDDSCVWRASRPYVLGLANPTVVDATIQERAASDTARSLRYSTTTGLCDAMRQLCDCAIDLSTVECA